MLLAPPGLLGPVSDEPPEIVDGLFSLCRAGGRSRTEEEGGAGVLVGAARQSQRAARQSPDLEKIAMCLTLQGLPPEVLTVGYHLVPPSTEAVRFERYRLSSWRYQS